MAIKTYSIKQHTRSYKLSSNFTLGEFACSDGSDTVLVCEDLITLLQKVRDHFGSAVTINSGYRTAAYNKAIGGATNSYHTKGQAADIVVAGFTPLAVAQYLEALGAGGIGLYSNRVHVDTRSVKYRYKHNGSTETAVSGFGGKTFAQQVQEKAGLDDNTMAYLKQYKYGDALLEKLAGAMK